MQPNPMTARSEDRGLAKQGTRVPGAPRLQDSRAAYNREALESFAEVLAILREWVEDERKERKRTTSGATDDGASACSVC